MHKDAGKFKSKRKKIIKSRKFVGGKSVEIRQTQQIIFDLYTLVAFDKSTV